MTNRDEKRMMRRYFAGECADKRVPPFPEGGRSLAEEEPRKRRFSKGGGPGERILLAALYTGALTAVLLSGSFNASFRGEIPLSHRGVERLKKDVSRVIFETFQEYNQFKGVDHD